MVEAQPAQIKYRSLRKLVAIFILVYAFVQIFIAINQHFDLASTLPLKKYQGDSFSIGYLQDWKILVQDDTVNVEPEYNWFTDFLIRRDILAVLFISAQKKPLLQHLLLLASLTKNYGKSNFLTIRRSRCQIQLWLGVASGFSM